MSLDSASKDAKQSQLFSDCQEQLTSISQTYKRVLKYREDNVNGIKDDKEKIKENMDNPDNIVHHGQHRSTLPHILYVFRKRGLAFSRVMNMMFLALNQQRGGLFYYYSLCHGNSYDLLPLPRS
jgi:Na+/melibiose symporter-like transporter